MLTQIRGDASLLTKVRVIAGNAVTAPHMAELWEGATDSDQETRVKHYSLCYFMCSCALERKRQLSKMKKNQTSRRPLLRAIKPLQMSESSIKQAKSSRVASPFSGADMQNKINAGRSRGGVKE